MAAIDPLLRTMLEKGGSDLHLTVGLPPKSRISGSLQTIGDTPVTAQQMEALLKEICPEKRWKEFLERKDLDLAHEVEGLARFRANYLYNHWGQAAVLRQIPAKILSFSQLNLPEALKYFIRRPRDSQIAAWASKQSSPISSRQVLEMLKIFSFDDRKLECAKAAFDWVTDPAEFHTVYTSFTFESSRTQLSKFLAVKGGFAAPPSKP